MAHDEQRSMWFDPRPNRPNNWFLSDFLRAMEQAQLAKTLGRVGPNVCWLLTAIATREHALRYQQTPHFAERQIAELVGIPKTTLRTAVDRAVSSGWLQLVPTGNSGAWYRVLIPTGCEPTADVVRSAEPSGPVTPPTGPEPDQNRTRTGPEPDQKSTATGPTCIPNSLSNSLPPPPSPRHVGVGADEFYELVEALRRLKVRQPQTAMRRALSQGRTYAEIRARIRYYEDRPGAWGAGAMYFVLTCPDYAGAPIEDWPPPAAEWAQAQAGAAAEQERQRVADQRRREASAAADLARRTADKQQQLLLQFGEGIDQLTPKQRSELVKTSGPWVIREALRQPRWRESPLLRDALLAAFAAQAGQN